MEIESKFKTKTGFCHILPDKIVLSRDGVIGQISNITMGNSISRSLFIYSCIAMYFCYRAYQLFQTSEFTLMLVYLLPSLYLIYTVVSSINLSASPIIYRNKIKHIRFKKAIKGLTRARFEIVFENDEGQIKKRLILLPGSLGDGEEETSKALEIMKREELLIP